MVIYDHWFHAIFTRHQDGMKSAVAEYKHPCSIYIYIYIYIYIMRWVYLSRIYKILLSQFLISASLLKVSSSDETWEENG